MKIRPSVIKKLDNETSVWLVTSVLAVWLGSEVQRARLLNDGFCNKSLPVITLFEMLD